MKVFLAALLVYGLALAGLALGRLLGRPALWGTCGRDCDACPNGASSHAPLDGEQDADSH